MLTAYTDLKITNIFFRKEDIHIFTYSSRRTRPVTNYKYIKVNNKFSHLVKDKEHAKVFTCIQTII
jgi:hypothetical protein